MSMWTKYKIEDNKTYSGQTGKCSFQLTKQGKTWFIRHENVSTKKLTSPAAGKSVLPGEEWEYYVGDKTGSLLLLPALPDKPVIVKPANTFRILPGKSIDIYLTIPLWIQFYNGTAKSENLICEIPETEPSSTWFGDPDNGLMGYAYRGPIELSAKPEKTDPWLILCPVKIRNESAAALDFERMCLHCEQLDLYLLNERLFANEFRIRFKGVEQVGEVHITPGSPSLAEGARQIAQARTRPDKSLIKRSFYFIKSISQY